MDKKTTRETAYQLLRLISLYLSKSEEAPRFSVDEIEALLFMAKKHHMGALAVAALNSFGYASESGKLILAKAQRKAVIYHNEYDTICKELEKHRIRYLPLKGVLLAGLYPSFGLREMSDIDILICSDSFDTVKEIMRSHHYSVKFYEKTNHDVYTKSPFLIFEMHRTLFNRFSYPKIQAYFDSKSYLQISDDLYRLKMTVEENYIYLIAHAYIHYAGAGTGLRTLLDIYLYLKRYKSEMDTQTISAELKKLSIEDFERKLRNLSSKILLPDSLTDEEAEELDYFINSGAHGTGAILNKNRMASFKRKRTRGTKLGYIAYRLKPPSQVIGRHPFFSRHPSLIPLLGFGRLAGASLKKPGAIIKELKGLKDFSDE